MALITYNYVYQPIYVLYTCKTRPKRLMLFHNPEEYFTEIVQRKKPQARKFYKLVVPSIININGKYTLFPLLETVYENINLLENGIMNGPYELCDIRQNYTKFLNNYIGHVSRDSFMFLSEDNTKKYGIKYIHKTLVDGEYLDDLSELNEEVKCTFIKASMGIGKTNSICAYLVNSRANKILFISPRRTISSTIASKCQAVGLSINNYMFLEPDDFNDVEKIGRLIVSPNSLIKFGSLISYDIIILDEIMLFIEYIFSEHARKRRLMIKILFELLNRAKQIIYSDAFITSHVIYLLSEYSNSVNTLVYDIHKESQLNVHTINIETLDNLIEYIGNIEPVYIFCETKKLALNIYNKYIVNGTNKNDILLITSEVSNKVSVLKNPNDTFPNYKVVITSPIVLSGFDFNIEYFIHIYGVYYGNILTPISLIQMAGRIRRAQNCTFVKFGKISSKRSSLNIMSVLPHTEEYFMSNIDNFPFIQLKIRTINEMQKIVCIDTSDVVTQLCIYNYNYKKLSRGKLLMFLTLTFKYLYVQ